MVCEGRSVELKVAVRELAQKKKPEPKPKPKPRRLVKADPDRLHRSAAAANRSVYYYDVTPDGRPTYRKHTLTLSEQLLSGKATPDMYCKTPCQADPDRANPTPNQDKPGVAADRTVDYQAGKMDKNGHIDSHDVPFKPSRIVWTQ